MKMDMNQAKEWLDKATGEAQEVIANPSQVDQILIQLEDKLKEVPAIGDTLSGLPTMIAMVKAWVTKEYTEVSPKVIACLVGSIIYLLKKNDLISDRIPIIGIADDLAVVGLALKLSEQELEAFRNWRDNH
jgi:uncharacterized membrane protein YkvA (DUF1232 family)